ncbi:MAG: FAD/NAD(P)-binding protein [Parvibaculaceae bacterium]
MNRRIVVIGGGAAGAWMLLRLLQRGREAIDVVEPRRGLAYSASFDKHLLNVTASRMDMLAEDGDPLFGPWLGARPGHDYVPRRLYGDFIEQAVAKAVAGKDVRHFRTAATAIRAAGDGLVIALADGTALSAAHAVLALGNLPPKLLAPGIDDPRIVENPWSLTPAMAEGRDRIVVAGTGLTALDAVVLLADANPASQFTLAAAHPLMPPCDRTVTPWPTAEHAVGLAPAAIWGMAKRAIRARDWYEVVDGLRAHVEAIWTRWTPEQRRSFVTHGARLWLHHRHRSPPPTWRRIEELRTAGRLSLHAGRVRRLTPRPRHIDVDLAAGTVPADLVVNTTGPGLSLRAHGLLGAALDAGLITECPMGLGIAVDDDGRCPTRNGSPSRLFALGTLTRGRFFETVAVPHIARRAGDIARAIVD